MRAPKIHYLFILVFLSSLTVDVLAQNPGRAAYVNAENLRKAKRYNEAIEKYDEAIRLEGDNYRYPFSKGKCYYAMKEYDLALSTFEETVELKNDFVFAYTLIAKIYRKKEDNSNAIYYYDMAFKKENNPKRKIGYKLEVVKLLLKDGKDDEARRHLAEAERLAPDNQNIQYYTAKLANQKGDYSTAMRAVEAAISSLPDNSPPAQSAKYYYELGVAQNGLGDFQGASKSWEKAYFGAYKRAIDRERSKNSPAYFYRLAVSYFSTGSYQKCRQQIEKALELQNSFSAAYSLMGKMEKKQGNFSSAVTNYRSAASYENDPNKKLRLQKTLASLQIDAGDYSGALKTANEVLAKSPGSADVKYLKATAQYHLGQYGGSISTLESLLITTKDSKAKAKYNFLLGLAARKTDAVRAKAAFTAAMVGPYKPAAKNELDAL